MAYDAPPPKDRPFWADNGYGEIIRVRWSPDTTGFAPCAMYEPLDAGDECDGKPLIWEAEITAWDDDRAALATGAAA